MRRTRAGLLWQGAAPFPIAPGLLHGLRTAASPEEHPRCPTEGLYSVRYLECLSTSDIAWRVRVWRRDVRVGGHNVVVPAASLR